MGDHRGGMRAQDPAGGSGETSIRVRYNECDPMGVAHHASYVGWLEIGRTELLRERGASYRELEEAGVFLAVVSLEVKYMLPARYDDLLRIRTLITGGGRARIDHEYEVWRDGERASGGEAMLARGRSTLACIDRDGRPRPLPDWLMPPTRSRRV